MDFIIKFKHIDGYVFWDSDENFKQFKKSDCVRVLRKLFKLGFVFTVNRYNTIEDVWKARSSYVSTWDRWNFVGLGGNGIEGCKKRIQTGNYDSCYIPSNSLIMPINVFVVIYRIIQFKDFVKRIVNKFFNIIESDTIPPLYYTDELSPYIQSPYSSNVQYQSD